MKQNNIREKGGGGRIKGTGDVIKVRWTCGIQKGIS